MKKISTAYMFAILFLLVSIAVVFGKVINPYTSAPILQAESGYTLIGGSASCVETSSDKYNLVSCFGGIAGHAESENYSLDAGPLNYFFGE